MGRREADSVHVALEVSEKLSAAARALQEREAEVASLRERLRAADEREAASLAQTRGLEDALAKLRQEAAAERAVPWLGPWVPAGS